MSSTSTVELTDDIAAHGRFEADRQRRVAGRGWAKAVQDAIRRSRPARVC